MSVPTGPSFFVDIYNATLTPNGGGSGSAVNIYGIKGITISRNETQMKGYDNNKLRPVATYTTAIDDEITISTEDFNVISSLLSNVGPNTFVFNARAADHYTVGANQLADQTVTITNFVINKKSASNTAKQNGTYSISGFCMENSAGDGTDPITITVASSPPSNTAN